MFGLGPRNIFNLPPRKREEAMSTEMKREIVRREVSVDGIIWTDVSAGLINNAGLFDLLVGGKTLQLRTIVKFDSGIPQIERVVHVGPVTPQVD